MVQASKPPMQPRTTVRRIWRTSGSLFNWLFLLLSLFITGWVYLVYRSALVTDLYPGPYDAPFKQFGIVSFVLVLLVIAYTLRRRFVRKLPGKVQDWLWLHVWFGISSIFIAGMHDNFQSLTHDFSFMTRRFTEAAYGTSALYALLVLVVSGVVGRLLDVWLARSIAKEADTNGVGIIQSVEDRLFELSLVVERFSAGKSAQFKQYCDEALHAHGKLPALLPVLSPREVNDFQRTYEVLTEHANLERSLQRQKRATLIIRLWRLIHIPLAYIALFIIGFHSLFELWKMLVLHQ